MDKVNNVLGFVGDRLVRLEDGREVAVCLGKVFLGDRGEVGALFLLDVNGVVSS